MTQDSLLSRRLRNVRFKIRTHTNAYTKLLLAFQGREHVLPNFLIIGAMKSGTTSLFHYLSQHPGFMAPSVKEIHYFDSRLRHSFGENWYRTHFPHKDELKARAEKIGYPALTAEATPAMISRFYALNAAHTLPNAKIIILLRNPVDRAYSHYHHQRRSLRGEPLSFWDALQSERSRTEHDMTLNREDPKRAGGAMKCYTYLQRGHYIDQIEDWMQFYPREQIGIFSYDALTQSPNRVCNDVCAFVGLPQHSFETSQKLNTGQYGEPMEDRCREYLTQEFRPYNRRLFEFLGEDWGWPS